MGNVTVNSILFQPPSLSSYNAHLNGHIIWLKTSTMNRIPSLFFRRPGAQLTILYSHANAEDLSLVYGWLKNLSQRLNVNVFAYDYTGYGDSVGTPSETNCYADIDAAYAYLLEKRNIKPEKIILYGKSVGSGPSVYLATKTAQNGQSVGGLLLHSPFMSVYRVIFDMGFTMSGDKFPNIDRIGNVRCPTFVIHGENDDVISIMHGRELYQAIPDKYKVDPFWVKRRGHNDIELEDMVFLKRVGKFIAYCIHRKVDQTRSPPMTICSHVTDEGINSPCSCLYLYSSAVISSQ